MHACTHAYMGMDRHACTHTHTESLSLVGGLLMLNAHMIAEEAKREGRHHAARAVISRTQLLGRLLLPTGYHTRARTPARCARARTHTY